AGERGEGVNERERPAFAGAFSDDSAAAGQYFATTGPQPSKKTQLVNL
ncbi:MAG: hypothetical protein QOG38_709, partial [Hyphomicrobiales bacterium]|nr:hypothetical protein [Hyphomicrobiales bacterium]